jgi:hypothetical protein
MLREKSVLRHLFKFSGFQVKHNSASTNNRDCATTISMVLGQLRAGKVWRPRITVWLRADESITANPDERPASVGTPLPTISVLWRGLSVENLGVQVFR